MEATNKAKENDPTSGNNVFASSGVDA